jgi:hypothetical protein
VRTPAKASAAAASQAHAAFGLRSPTTAAAATISGDGVSPRAIAACNGSPPGSAACTAMAVLGREAASRARQLKITRSTPRSSSVTRLDGAVGVDSERAFSSSDIDPASHARRPVNTS